MSTAVGYPNPATDDLRPSAMQKCLVPTGQPCATPPPRMRWGSATKQRPGSRPLQPLTRTTDKAIPQARPPARPAPSLMALVLRPPARRLAVPSSHDTHPVSLAGISRTVNTKGILSSHGRGVHQRRRSTTNKRQLTANGPRHRQPPTAVKEPPTAKPWAQQGCPYGGNEKRVRNASRNERSRERSLLHGQDLGNTQNRRNSVEQWLAVGGWRLVAVGGWRSPVSGWWSLGAVLKGHTR